MARKKRKKRSWRRTLLIFAITPLAVWFIALLIWFFWYDIARLVAPPSETPRRPAAGSARSGESSKDRELQPAPRENIPNEDREKLDDILKRR
ncbi:MAG: hypothetical protein ACREQV_20525 [Candidatus Binatia bacterium]